MYHECVYSFLRDCKLWLMQTLASVLVCSFLFVFTGHGSNYFCQWELAELSHETSYCSDFKDLLLVVPFAPESNSEIAFGKLNLAINMVKASTNDISGCCFNQCLFYFLCRCA